MVSQQTEKKEKMVWKRNCFPGSTKCLYLIWQLERNLGQTYLYFLMDQIVMWFLSTLSIQRHCMYFFSYVESYVVDLHCCLKRHRSRMWTNVVYSSFKLSGWYEICAFITVRSVETFFWALYIFRNCLSHWPSKVRISWISSIHAPHSVNVNWKSRPCQINKPLFDNLLRLYHPSLAQTLLHSPGLDALAQISLH